MKNFKRGLKAGIPIGFGYLSVSFTFGIIAISYGFTTLQAVLISMLTLTSAGQFAGITVMLTPGHYLEMLLSQLTINMRYSFMSISLSQKADKAFTKIWRMLAAFAITDEIFAVAVSEKSLSKSFFAGLTVMPYIGWSLGTLCGALLGNILPAAVMSALSLAIYGMFVAIVVPDMKKSKPVIITVIIAAAMSTGFKYIPVLKDVSAGIAITVCALTSAAICAFLFPVSQAENADKGGNE